MCKIKPGQGKHCITLPAASCEARNIKSRYTNILAYGGNGVKGNTQHKHVQPFCQFRKNRVEYTPVADPGFPIGGACTC